MKKSNFGVKEFLIVVGVVGIAVSSFVNTLASKEVVREMKKPLYKKWEFLLPFIALLFGIATTIFYYVFIAIFK